ncbi:hypothetical protein DFH06DRAFT_1300542 [Mycena polygramma]|nr:hypothetical protein DFH06DRAFT_1300542 [Mycena polygramma]
MCMPQAGFEPASSTEAEDLPTESTGATGMMGELIGDLSPGEFPRAKTLDGNPSTKIPDIVGGNSLHQSCWSDFTGRNISKLPWSENTSVNPLHGIRWMEVRIVPGRKSQWLEAIVSRSPAPCLAALDAIFALAYPAVDRVNDGCGKAQLVHIALKLWGSPTTFENQETRCEESARVQGGDWRVEGTSLSLSLISSLDLTPHGLEIHSTPSPAARSAGASRRSPSSAFRLFPRPRPACSTNIHIHPLDTRVVSLLFVTPMPAA